MFPQRAHGVIEQPGQCRLLYSAGWGHPVGPKFARNGMASYLSSRAYTIYGGASEVQKDVIAKNVLGIKSGKK